MSIDLDLCFPVVHIDAQVALAATVALVIAQIVEKVTVEVGRGVIDLPYSVASDDTSTLPTGLVTLVSSRDAFAGTDSGSGNSP